MAATIKPVLKKEDKTQSQKESEKVVVASKENSLRKVESVADVKIAPKTEEKKIPTPRSEDATSDAASNVLKHEDLEGLSESGKEILKQGKQVTAKFAHSSPTSSISSSPTARVSSRAPSDLEEQVTREQVTASQNRQHFEYGTQLAKQPADTLYQEMTHLYHLAGEKGYLNPEEQRRVQYLTSAVEQKVQDAEEHRYEMTEEAAAVIGITRQIGSKLRSLYKGETDYHPQYKFN